MSIFKPHTIKVERLSDEIRKTAGGIAPGNTCAVVERYDGMLVKVCHVGNLRGHGFRALTLVAQQYAKSYGAVFMATDIVDLRKGVGKSARRS